MEVEERKRKKRLGFPFEGVFARSWMRKEKRKKKKICLEEDLEVEFEEDWRDWE